MLGTVIVNEWKALKIGDSSSLSVREFDELLRRELIKDANELEEREKVKHKICWKGGDMQNWNSTSVSSLSLLLKYAALTQK